MIYEELKETLIEKGVDSKLFDMPAVRERLEEAYYEKIRYSLDDFIVNPDGTFNFGNCIMQKGTIEREENVPIGTAERVIDPINGETEEYTVYEKQKVPKQMLTIVEYFEKEHQKNQALDAPFNLREDYEPTFKELAAQLTIVDEDGIETETKDIDNGIYVRQQLQQGTLSYKSFEKPPIIVNRSLTRAKGIVIEEEKEETTYIAEKAKVRKNEFYDNGSWKLDLTGRSSIGTKDGNSPVSAIKEFEYNSQKLLRKYPHLEATIRKREEELLELIDSRTLDAISENINLRGQNDRLQKMLKKALTFVQTVKDSRVGNLFFGRKAKEVLGEQDKNVKEFPEVK